MNIQLFVSTNLSDNSMVNSHLSHGRFAMILCVLLPLTGFASAQPLTDRTPNLGGTWVAEPLHLGFAFSHRFETAGEDADITDIFGDATIVNYPTFDLALGLPENLMAGVRYSSSSLVADGQPNEWQPYLKWAPIRDAALGPVPLSVSLLGAWNTANESLDGEVAAQADITDFAFISGAARGFTSLYGDLADENSRQALALAGGLGLRVNRYVTLAGDIGGVLSGGERAGESPDPTWSAGVHVEIPFTPHTFSIMATNVTSGTLQGTSGIPDGLPGNNVYWGFEFTVPFSGFARWSRIFSPEETTSEHSSPTMRDTTVVVDMVDMVFKEDSLEITPGTTVRWVNKDPIAHTATSDDGIWDSSFLVEGDSYEYTFTEVGEYPYTCTPHPEMVGMIVVVDE